MHINVMVKLRRKKLTYNVLLKKIVSNLQLSTIFLTAIYRRIVLHFS